MCGRTKSDWRVALSPTVSSWMIWREKKSSSYWQKASKWRSIQMTQLISKAIFLTTFMHWAKLSANRGPNHSIGQKCLWDCLVTRRREEEVVSSGSRCFCRGEKQLIFILIQAKLHKGKTNNHPNTGLEWLFFACSLNMKIFLTKDHARCHEQDTRSNQ